MEPPYFASVKTKMPPMIHSTAPIVEAGPIPIESINGTIDALPEAPKMYWIKYFDAMTAVRCSGIASEKDS